MSDSVRRQPAAATSWALPDIEPPDARARRAATLDEERECIRAEAYQQGYAAGLAAGESEAQKRISRLDELLDCLAQPLAALDEEVEEALCDLSFRVARHVVRRELQIDRSQVVAVVRESLQALPLNARNVRVRMHPADAELVRRSLAEQKLNRSWELVEDPLLTRGGCRVESNSSTVDARIEKRLARILEQLVADERHEPRGVPDAD